MIRWANCHVFVSAWRKSTSDHIVAQQANRYIVAFDIAILYDMQRPRYNGRAACVVCVDGPLFALTSALQRVKHTE